MFLSNIQNKTATTGKFLETRTIKVIGLLSKRVVRQSVFWRKVAMQFTSDLEFNPGLGCYLKF